MKEWLRSVLVVAVCLGSTGISLAAATSHTRVRLGEVSSTAASEDVLILKKENVYALAQLPDVQSITPTVEDDPPITLATPEVVASSQPTIKPVATASPATKPSVAASAANETSSSSSSTSSTLTSSANPLAGKVLYVDPGTLGAKWQAVTADASPDISKITTRPQARWFGEWNPSIESDVSLYVANASSQGALPVLVAYNIPFRDCGGYSNGGASSATYSDWIKGMARGIAGRQVAVVLEPDALASVSCLSTDQLTERYALLAQAGKTLKASGAAVYLDAGHGAWVGAVEMADRLTKAGIDYIDGFSLNVSNFRTNTESAAYGKTVSGLLGGAHFVIDTSRNGAGPSGGEWCNPSGRALGQLPTTNTGNTLIDAYLWIKNPGESDGTCNGGPPAGQWWPEYALSLARNTQ